MYQHIEYQLTLILDVTSKTGQVKDVHLSAL